MKNLLFILILGFQVVNAQQFYRIKSDVSIKDKLSNGTYRGIASEAGHPDGQGMCESCGLGTVVLQPLGVGSQGRRVAEPHPRLQAPCNEAGSIAGEIGAARLNQARADGRQRVEKA